MLELLLVYVAVGAGVALRCVPWAARCYFVAWLPYPEEPAAVNLSRAIGTLGVFLLVLLLWPAYLRLWWLERRDIDGDAGGGQDAAP